MHDHYATMKSRRGEESARGLLCFETNSKTQMRFEFNSIAVLHKMRWRTTTVVEIDRVNNIRAPHSATGRWATAAYSSTQARPLD